MDILLQQIQYYVQEGRLPKVRESIMAALKQGISPENILNDGLIDGMDILSKRYSSHEVFVPEVLIAARALNKGMEMLAPYFQIKLPTPLGTAVIGTVRGDLHDIGKNLVKMMLESKGICVIDLGVDVSADTFLSAVSKYQAELVICSTLLTTTMCEMQNIVAKLRAAIFSHSFKIMIGGAPITQAFCTQIGADIYTENAAQAADCAIQLLHEMIN